MGRPKKNATPKLGSALAANIITELDKHINNLPEDEATRLGKQIARGVAIGLADDSVHNYIAVKMFKLSIGDRT